MAVQHGYHPEDLYQVGGPSVRGSAEVPDPIEPNGSSADLTDGFYQFKSEAMASWFAIDLAMRQDRIAAIIGGPLLEVYDDDTKAATLVGDGESFFPCFLGMAMGWSWA
eukprot:15918093-Heterocapsa_arctica.AAC.1